MAHLFRVILPVDDIERATRFYAAILGEPGSRVSPGRHYFDCEGTILACYDPRSDGDDRPATPNPEPLYFAVSDLRSTFDACRSAGARFSPELVPGVGPLGQIARRPWGEESFYAHDPFGNPLCFVSKTSVFTGGTDAL
jgi:catechol 2,3-dioxygenase-like lactoylglutathione lyase family enzyme